MPMIAVAWALLWAGLLQAAPVAEPNSLVAVTADGDRVSFQFTRAVAEHVAFHDAPPRLLLDFDRTRIMAASRIVEGDGALVRRVRSGHLETDPLPVTRVVVDLAERAAWRTEWEGATLRLVVGDGGPAVRTAAPPEPEPAPRQARKAKPAAPSAAPTAVGSWVVQAGSFGDESRAGAVRASLEKVVASAAIDKVEAGGKAVFRVRVGPFATRAEAEQAVKAAKGAGLDAFLRRN